MKNSFRSSGRGLPRIVFLIVLGLMLCPAFAPMTALAENVTYDGSDPSMQQAITNAWGVTYADGVAPSSSDSRKSNSLSGNRVTINGGTTGYVFGAVNTLDSAAVTNNQVIVNSGMVNEDVYGGFHEIDSGSATATGNTVTINSGGTVRGVVYGGYAWSSTGTVNSNNNSVSISSGTVTGDVFGGWVASGGAPGTATATYNTVTISGSPTLTNSVLYGGLTTGAGDAFTGNTLNLMSSGINVKGVQNFQYLNFYLPTTLGAGGTMLKISAGGEAKIDDSTVNVGINGASSPLQAGDTVNLIDASLGTLNGTPSNTTANGKGMQGVTLLYEFDIEADNTTGLLTATVAVADSGSGSGSGPGPKVNPQTKALSESFVGGLSLAAQGADVIAGPGMGNAVASTQGAAGGPVIAGFGALSGGSTRIKSGSHVDMNSISLLAGLAWGRDLAPGRLTLGGFFEWGNGSYDTYNSFSNAATVKGKGDTYYLGGGILGRMDFTNTGPGRFYTEGSARIGSIRNDYNSGDLRDAMGRKAEYDSSSAYYGLHLGAGYIWNLNEKASLDLYGKYFWTRVEGDSVTLSTGDPVKFKDVESQRVRLGSRFTYAVNECVSPYIGAAWEHEFDGKARASTNGFAIDAPTLRGDTGIGELGFTLTPSKNLPLFFDLGVQGYTGQREGVTGSLQMRLEF